MDENFVADLHAAPERTRSRKQTLEQVRDGFNQIPGPDPAELLDGQPRGLTSMKVLFTLTAAELVRIENDIEVLETCVQTLELAISMAESDRDKEARELAEALPDLLRQLTILRPRRSEGGGAA